MSFMNALETIVISIIVALLFACFVIGGSYYMIIIMVLGIILGFFLEGKYMHVNRMFSFLR